MQFLYFESASKSDRSQIAYAGVSFHERNNVSGPDHQRGVILSRSIGSSVAKVCYSCDAQVWRQKPNSDYWVGYWKDDPPLPSELMRPDAIPGHAITLGDGHAWTIPVARRCVGESLQLEAALPVVMDLDPDGNWMQGSVVSKHQRLWDASQNWLDWMMSAQFGEEIGAVELLVSDVANSCVIALQTNYFLSSIEVAMLGLLTSHTRAEIMNATIDFPTMLDHIKKNGTAKRSGLVPGRTEDILDTVPA